MSHSKITIDSEISAGVDKVWEYWTNPEHITKWNFASDDWCCPSASNDLIIGGKYMARMEAKDGSFGFDFIATYDNVERLKTLSYTLDDGRKVITQFESMGDMTRVKTCFDAESQNSKDMQRKGWQAILDNFKKYVEST